MYYSNINYTKITAAINKKKDENILLVPLLLSNCYKSYTINLGECVKNAYKYISPMIDFIDKTFIEIEYPIFT